jgi:dTDP-4-dehydrorhamnose reductase
LGSFGWNSLLTKPNGDYESGVFDIRPGEPIPTPVAEYFIELSKDPEYIHPAEQEKGWWCREDRFIFDTEEALQLHRASLEPAVFKSPLQGSR